MQAITQEKHEAKEQNVLKGQPMAPKLDFIERIMAATHFPFLQGAFLMKSFLVSLLGLVLSVSVGAEPLLKGRSGWRRGRRRLGFRCGCST